MGGYGMAAKMRELTEQNIMHPIAVISCRECFL